MNIHEVLPYLIAAMAWFVGGYILKNIKKVRNDRITRIYFVTLGLLNIYTAIVYTLIILGIVSAIPPTESSLLMRPANILYIAVPFFIAWRMGL